MERASDLRDFVASALELQDPVGVLSVTIGIEPGAASGGTPPWEIALENDLAQLRRDGLLTLASTRSLEEISARLLALSIRRREAGVARCTSRSSQENPAT